MITLNHLVRRKADVSSTTFRDYWLSTHATERARLSPALGIRRFTSCETLHEDEVNKVMQQLYNTATDVYDFVDQMVINDLAEFKEGLADVETAAALGALHKGEVDYVDYARSDYWFTIDLPQLYPRQNYRATSENNWLKGFYVPRRHEHLSLAETQLHWNSSHGGMAREFAEMLPFEKYLQGHRIESAVVDGFKASLGTPFENVDLIVGQAETWMDRRIMPSLQTPEAGRMMGMLTQDIAIMVDSTVSHSFVTKEHVMLDKPLFADDRSLPTLFNVD